MEEKRELTLEQVELICNGKSPDGITHEEFVYLRREINKIQRKRIRGVGIIEMKKGMPPIVKRGGIGRNQLCLCGSGKKYKNCCINKKNV